MPDHEREKTIRDEFLFELLLSLPPLSLFLFYSNQFTFGFSAQLLLESLQELIEGRKFLAENINIKNHQESNIIRWKTVNTWITVNF